MAPWLPHVGFSKQKTVLANLSRLFLWNFSVFFFFYYFLVDKHTQAIKGHKFFRSWPKAIQPGSFCVLTLANYPTLRAVGLWRAILRPKKTGCLRWDAVTFLCICYDRTNFCLRLVLLIPIQCNFSSGECLCMSSSGRGLRTNLWYDSGEGCGQQRG